MDRLELKEKRRQWGRDYRDRKKAGLTAPPRPHTPASEEPVMLSPSSDKNILELSAMTPIQVRFADGCTWDGVLSRRMDEALADHRQRHGRSVKQEVECD